MIRISCTNCKTILSIDDAFAGGVCRCQHCGTIQTVPASARGNATTAASGQSIGGQKSLYQNGESNTANSNGGGGTGLDDLASIVVSSGLASSRLTRSARTAEERSSKQQLLIPALIAAGAVVIVLVFVILYLVLRNTTPTPSGGGGGGNPQTSGQTSPAITGPSFCGTSLTGNTVIYVLDHGGASQAFLGELKDATIKSLGSLTDTRKFAIFFWTETGKAVPGYPDGTTAYATKDSIASAREALNAIAAYGQTDITAALQQAIDQHPDEIIIATPKGLDLNDAWKDNILKLRGNQSIKIDTYNLSSVECGPLKRLAEQTGGTYHELTAAQLRSFGE